MRIGRLFFTVAAVMTLLSSGCASLPEPKHSWQKFPQNAYLGKPTRLYTVIGTVRSKVEFQTLDSNYEESTLCQNYFNQATKKLLEYAKAKNADAVMDVRAVVFYLDGKRQVYSHAECSDDGAEGQVLTEGTAIKWKPEKPESDETERMKWDFPGSDPSVGATPVVTPKPQTVPKRR